MTPAETLKLIDELRARGATSVEVNGVKATFGPAPAVPRDPLEPEAKREKDERARSGRSIDARLFGPLGIAPKQEAAG